MRASLFGLNVMALAAAVVPAVLIFNAAAMAHPLAPVSRETFFGLLGAGALMCLVAAAALTKRRRPDPTLAVRLMSLGALLFTGAISWALTLFVMS